MTERVKHAQRSKRSHKKYIPFEMFRRRGDIRELVSVVAETKTDSKTKNGKSFLWKLFGD